MDGLADLMTAAQTVCLAAQACDLKSIGARFPGGPKLRLSDLSIRSSPKRESLDFKVADLNCKGIVLLFIGFPLVAICF